MPPEKDRAMAEVPEIETERLLLRGHRLDDFDASAAMWADPAVARHIGGKPSTQEESWGRFLRYAGMWPLLGFGYWAIATKASGRFVGEAGFADFKRDLTPGFGGDPEIGWALASTAHGQGYGTEVVGALVAWGDANLPVKRTVCMIHPDNSPSIYVAKKFGYREFARATYKGQPTILFRR